MVAWQRGIGNGLQLDKLLTSSREILKHELMPIPIAIAETNGSLRSGNKSLLLDILLKNVDNNGVRL